MTVSWLSIISVFRLWGPFRIFIDVFIKTINESKPFLLALALMLISTTDFYYYKYRETRSYEYTHGYFLTFLMQYRIIVFSDFEYLVDEYDFIDLTFFMVFSVVIFVFLMNLLIADISYQHSIIMSEVRRTDYAHICRLVLELETMEITLKKCCVRKRAGDSFHLVFAEYEKVENETPLDVIQSTIEQ